MNSTPTPALLELKDATVVFGHGADRTVANYKINLRLEEEPARIINIVGESGSGKTTATRVLLGLQPPTHGQALWRGKDIYGLSKKELIEFRGDVQAVFQDPYGIFNPYYKIDRVFTMAIRKFRLAKNKGRYPHQLSGGERQRVMLARAYLLKPKVIVADEAISMLDVAVRAVIMNILLDFRERLGISTVFITHDLSAAHYLGGDIMVMKRGHVVEEGAVDNVLNNPQHIYTRLLLESIPSPDPDEQWTTTAEDIAELSQSAGVSTV
jgi:ABC-type oligopeptide transport system ATPase subunit